MTYNWDEDVDWSLEDVDPMQAAAVSDTVFRDRAACKDSDPSLFFLERGQSTLPAKQICYSCPVQVECLEYVMSIPGPSVGVWGGYSEDERRRLKRLRKEGLA